MSKNYFMTAAKTANNVLNDIRIIHVLASGDDFDKIHSITNDVIYVLESNIDKLLEFAVSAKEEIESLNAKNDYEAIDPKQDFSNYEEIVGMITTMLKAYLEIVKDCYKSEAVKDRKETEAKLDDLISCWDKELNYKFPQITDTVEKAINASFVNTGFDEALAKIIKSRYESE